MIQILLTPNDNTGREKTVRVSNRVYNKLQQLENAGGFKRFSIDVYDYVKGGKTDFIDLYIFLSWVFFNLNCTQITALVK